MIGTYFNTGTIIAGTLIGCALKKGINEKKSATLLQAMGLAATAIGINSLVSNMAKSELPVLFIVALAIGGYVGESIDLDARVNGLKSRFTGLNIEGVVTAVLLFCVGTLAILGPIESALNHDNTLLFTNGTLDFVTSMVLASSFGLSILIAAPILFAWQGSIYMLANYLADFFTPALMAEIGVVGGILILCTGLSILKVVQIKTINFLPALLVPIIYFWAIF
ncbi:DUF554 domain-containing protein [Candidatus Epulonipiscium viviparus]|uniref:DUF554 domain-containing protein n=1 Tax=Candidatus Epulonipiscium viviparus TaxID=420336 RepID=UPI00016C0082|nr:DUF554 domain-containing protein [Candidatus Epulopiscium viviparus]